MRNLKIILVALILGIAFTSCEKENFTPEPKEQIYVEDTVDHSREYERKILWEEDMICDTVIQWIEENILDTTLTFQLDGRKPTISFTDATTKFVYYTMYNVEPTKDSHGINIFVKFITSYNTYDATITPYNIVVTEAIIDSSAPFSKPETNVVYETNVFK